MLFYLSVPMSQEKCGEKNIKKESQNNANGDILNTFNTFVYCHYNASHVTEQILLT